MQHCIRRVFMLFWVLYMWADVVTSWHAPLMHHVPLSCLYLCGTHNFMFRQVLSDKEHPAVKTPTLVLAFVVLCIQVCTKHKLVKAFFMACFVWLAKNQETDTEVNRALVKLSEYLEVMVWEYLSGGGAEKKFKQLVAVNSGKVCFYHVRGSIRQLPTNNAVLYSARDIMKTIQLSNDRETNYFVCFVFCKKGEHNFVHGFHVTIIRAENKKVEMFVVIDGNADYLFKFMQKMDIRDRTQKDGAQWVRQIKKEEGACFEYALEMSSSFNDESLLLSPPNDDWNMMLDLILSAFKLRHNRCPIQQY